MAKKGLVFIQNEYPKNGEDFLYRQKYRFIPNFGRSIKTIIEVEIYENNICVISFYEHNKGTDKTKYKDEADIFYSEFEKKVEANLNEEDNDSDKP